MSRRRGVPQPSAVDVKKKTAEDEEQFTLATSECPAIDQKSLDSIPKLWNPDSKEGIDAKHAVSTLAICKAVSCNLLIITSADTG